MSGSTPCHTNLSTEKSKVSPMKKVIISVLVLFSLVSCIKEKQIDAELVVGDSIPDFTVVMNDGTQLTGSQLRQGISYIVFFTTECPDCKEVLPHIQELYNEYSSKGVQFALISREDGPSSVADYWNEKKYTMPYSAQSDRTIYELFAKTRVPRVYLCKDGVIKAIFTDQPSNPTYYDMKDALESL